MPDRMSIRGINPSNRIEFELLDRIWPSKCWIGCFDAEHNLTAQDYVDTKLTT